MSEYLDLQDVTWRLEGQSGAVVPAPAVAVESVPSASQLAVAPPAQVAAPAAAQGLPLLGLAEDLLATFEGFEAKVAATMNQQELQRLSQRLQQVNSAVLMRVGHLQALAVAAPQDSLHQPD